MCGINPYSRALNFKQVWYSDHGNVPNDQMVCYLDQHLNSDQKVCYSGHRLQDWWPEYSGDVNSRYRIANWDLKSEHSKSGNIWNPDFLKVGFQMVPTIQKSEKIPNLVYSRGSKTELGKPNAILIRNILKVGNRTLWFRTVDRNKKTGD